MSRFKTPTKGKSTAAPKKPARRTLPAPTPASIHALFVALRTLGWRSGMEHAHGTRRPPPESVPVNASTPLPSAEQIEATFMAAWKLGWEAISNDEASFLLGRNRLTQDGIGHLYEVAICIQKDHPWQLSLAERCAGVYKVPHYCTSELPPVSPATPREQAMFAVLRQVGIYAYQELGHAPLKAPPLPDMEASSKRLTGAWHNAARVLAMELGWWRTNPREVELIHLLRRCNDKGRDILCATLSALLRRNRLGNYQGDTK